MHHLDDNTLLLLQLTAKTPFAHRAQFNCPFAKRLSTTPFYNPHIRRDGSGHSPPPSQWQHASPPAPSRQSAPHCAHPWAFVVWQRSCNQSPPLRPAQSMSLPLPQTPRSRPSTSTAGILTSLPPSRGCRRTLLI
jgi:hypothetical protein